MRKSRLNHALFLFQIGLNVAVSYVFAKLLAYRFGTSGEKDGFDIAFSVPLIILAVGGFGFLACVITTQVAKMLETSPGKIEDVFSTLLTYMAGICLVLLGSSALFTKELTHLLAPGLAPDVRVATERLVAYMLPLVITLGLSSFFAAILTAYSIPISMEFALVTTRLGAVGYALWLGSSFTLEDAACGLVVGSVLAAAAEWCLLWKVAGIRFRVQFYASAPELRSILRQSASLIGATVITQISWAYMRRVATLDSVGLNASLTCALSVISPAALLLAKPLALTQGPQIARLLARGDRSSARRIVVRSVLVCAGLGIAAACLIAAFASPMVRLLFGGGQFDEKAVAVTAEMLRLFVWGLPGPVVTWVILMPMLTMKNEHASALVLACGYATHLLLTALLFPALGKQGIAWGYVLSADLQAAIGGVVVFRDLRKAVRPGAEKTARSESLDLAAAQTKWRRVDPECEPGPRPAGVLARGGVNRTL